MINAVPGCTPQLVLAGGLSVVQGPGGTPQLQNQGGVPIVNIATPNGAGLSNNHFRDYNVGANGLILNNATGKTQPTQLGGIIVGNPNLKGGAAQMIPAVIRIWPAIRDLPGRVPVESQMITPMSRGCIPASRMPPWAAGAYLKPL